ncbi:MAG: HlyD family efflux transporter periplasmic adaptor subunit [Candidatus Pacebacteria bacterium]|nr:HlyD family efflux transporter periplasmic adaptor subunit [Candidatus Paceibacterota bacterium]
MGDIRTTDGENLPLTRNEKRRRLQWWLLGGAGLAVLLAIGGSLIHVRRYVRSPGYVTTENFAEVRPAVVGRVSKILVHSGMEVSQGQILVCLDSSEETAMLAEAQSQVRQLQAELARRKAEIADIRRRRTWNIREATYVLEDAQLNVQRIRNALNGEAASSGVSAELAALEAARGEVRKTRSQLARREAELAEAKRQLRWSKEEAGLVLENARSTASRTKQLVDAKLASATTLQEAQLRAQLAEVKLKALLDRDESIFEKELEVLRQELESRKNAVRRAEAQLRRRLAEAELQEKLATLRLKTLQEADLTIHDKELVVKHEELAAAQEVVNRMQAQIDAYNIRAPIDGQALRYEFVIGELVRPETVLAEIFGGDRQVLKLRVSERYATRVAPGQPYSAELAPYKGLQTVHFTGTVQYLRNVIQTEGQDTYRVAYCDFDQQGYTVPPGTTAEARIYYGTSSLWLYIFGLD